MSEGAVTDRVTGSSLILRRVLPDDDAYIHGLRMDPAYNRHLSAVTGTVEDQRRWIEAYKAREVAGTEVYFVITRKDGTRCGVVRIYGITGDQFTWGSWILDAHKPPKAALESAVLIYKYGFEVLALAKSVFDVRRDNERTLAFHRRFGATETGEDNLNIYFELTRASFNADLPTHLSALQLTERL